MRPAIILYVFGIFSLGFPINSDAEFVQKKEIPKNITEHDSEEPWKWSRSGWMEVSTNLFVRQCWREKKEEPAYMALDDQVFYIFSEQDGVFEYEKGVLDIDVVDLNRDGYKDFVFSGRVVYDGGHFFIAENVIFIYLCDPDKQKFVLRYKKAPYSLEIKNDAAIQWENRLKGELALMKESKDEDFMIEQMRKNRVLSTNSPPIDSE